MLSAFVRTSFAVLPLAATVSCSDATGPAPLPGGLDIRTSSSVIKLETAQGKRYATVTATVTNHSDRTVYYSYCGEGLSVRLDGRWHSIYRPVCAAILVPPAPIAPGESRPVSLLIDERHTIADIARLFDPDLTYRLDVVLLLKRKFSDDTFVVIDQEQSVSNSFKFAE
jgi:hypothetical protein